MVNALSRSVHVLHMTAVNSYEIDLEEQEKQSWKMKIT